MKIEHLAIWTENPDQVWKYGRLEDWK